MARSSMVSERRGSNSQESGSRHRKFCVPRMCSKVWLIRANDAAELGGREVAISWVSSGGSRPK